MTNKLFYNRVRRLPVIKRILAGLFIPGAIVLLYCPRLFAANDAPPWMHALVSAQLPEHDEKTDAVLLYSEENVKVFSADRITTQVRKVYKILRPTGRDYGVAYVPFHSGQKISSLHGWCIPAQGKDYEVKDKDAMEIAPAVDGGELMTDVRVKVLRIPAPDPGNLVGYEYEVEERPLLLQHNWEFQEESPVRESRYTLELPAGWEYKASWLNHSEVKPAEAGGSRWSWVLSNVKGVRKEEDMPPLEGVEGKMIISFFPPGGSAVNGFTDWTQMGRWYDNLVRGRRDASPAITEEVATLTSRRPMMFYKMRALGSFVQHDVRYVAIELGIGGFQPHPAADVFSHRYGDCKDKATLMSAMLHEIGVESYYVIINHERGSVNAETPAYSGFDHVVLAIRLPESATDTDLIATVQHPKLGRLLFFDPTDDFTPFGEIRGELQSNYGLLVAPYGGELIKLPKQAATTSGVQRTAKLTLDRSGTLKGDVTEIRLGDRATTERWALRTVTKDSDRVKPVEKVLADSLARFQITRMSVENLAQTDQPFGFDYSFTAEHYAQTAGDLLLVRPRTLGSKASGIMETRDARKFPVEFEGPLRDTDNFEITLPDGYVVDDLPPPVNADYDFAEYHAKSEVSGNVIHYTRTFEVKELSVPVSKLEELKTFYRIIATDERNTAVLKPVSK